MNRDELLARPQAFPPEIHPAPGMSLLYPREAGGGTWIGVNSRGILLALLNWNLPTVDVNVRKKISRGTLIPTLLSQATLDSADLYIQQLDLSSILPFRLFGFFPELLQIREWRWNLQYLDARSHPWQQNHWFSSSLSDELAAEGRSLAFRSDASRCVLEDPAAWLRRIHASHIPAPGPYSVCVHRPDAATVSFTEVHFRQAQVQMSYLPGSPCSAGNQFTVSTLDAPSTKIPQLRDTYATAAINNGIDSPTKDPIHER